MRSERHRDDRDLDAFTGETLLVCPSCGRMAWSRPVEQGSASGFTPRRLTCDACGLARSWASDSIRRIPRGDPVRDHYFGLPLWLQAPCCGELLWAYNTDHLAFLEAFVGARLRERRRSPEYGWRNRALVSRLPAWMKSKKHRDEVLSCIDRMRKTLE